MSNPIFSRDVPKYKDGTRSRLWKNNSGRRLSSFTTRGSFVESAPTRSFDLGASEACQNKNIVSIFKIFTSLDMAKDYVQVKSLQPYIGNTRTPIKSLPSYSDSSFYVLEGPSAPGSPNLSKKYSLLQNLLKTPWAEGPGQRSTESRGLQPLRKQTPDCLESLSKKILVPHKKRVVAQNAEASNSGTNGSYKQASFLTYWLLPFISLVPFVVSTNNPSLKVWVNPTTYLSNLTSVHGASETQPKAHRGPENHVPMQMSSTDGTSIGLSLTSYLKSIIGSNPNLSSLENSQHNLENTPISLSMGHKAITLYPASLDSKEKENARLLDSTFTLLTNNSTKPNYTQANFNYIPFKVTSNLSLDMLEQRWGILRPAVVKSSSSFGLSLTETRPESLSSKTHSKGMPHSFVLTYQNYIKYIRKKLTLLTETQPFSKRQFHLTAMAKAWSYTEASIFRGRVAAQTKDKQPGFKTFKVSDPMRPQRIWGIPGAKSINVVLNQKKLYVLPKVKEKSLVNDQSAILTTGQLPQLNNSFGTPQAYFDTNFSYFSQKKEMEKKRKAKKLRLESRRQKKRKRFYPRPTWLRLRLKLDQIGPTAQLKSRFAILPSSSQYNQIKNYKLLTPKFLMASVASNGQTKWNQALNLTTYNQFLYNLAFSIKDNLRYGPSTQSKTNSRGAYSAQQDNSDLSRNKVKLLQRAYGPLPEIYLQVPGNSHGLDSLHALKSNLTGKYKLENQKLAEFFYTKKLELTRKSLAKIKSKSNYINFEPKSANQTIPKKETNSSLYGCAPTAHRNFWLWLYNTTSTNQYNKTLLFDNFLTYMSLPLNMERTGGEHKIKTASNNRFNLWLPAQLAGGPFAHDNKNSLTMVPWAINKTNLQTTMNKRLSLWSSQKLRNQSKNNKTKWIQKQIQTKVNTFLSPSILKDIWTKKEQKAMGGRPVNSGYNLEEYAFYPEAPTAPTSEKFKKSLIFKIRQKIHQKEHKLSYLVNQTYPNKSVGYSLTSLADQSFYQKKFIGAERHNNSLNSSSLENQKLQVGVERRNNRLGNTLNSKASTNLTWWQNISLSPMEGLGFIKDLHNVDSLYNFVEPVNLSQKNSKIGPRSDLWRNNTVWLGLLVHFCALISLVSISQIRCFIKFHFILIHKLSNSYLAILYKITSSISRGLFQKETKSFQSPPNTSNLNTQFSVGHTKHLSTNRLEPLQQIATKSEPRSGLWTKDKAQVLSSSLVQKSRSGPNLTNLRILFEKQSLLRSTSSSAFRYAKSVPNKNILTLSLNNSFGDKSNNLNLLYPTSKYPEAPTAPKKQFSQISPNLKSSDYTKLLTQTVQIQSLAKQSDIREWAQYFTKTTKKTALNAGFKIVDTFESCLRLIYGFFEKPAEFTMDWIAYAFLVEWSSDLLSYTPQKSETQNWLAFSKIIRQNQVGFVWYGQALNINLFYLAPTIVFTQFLSKRFLYLNDLFLSVLYKPDTDLLLRQKKGTLFWDIWSDFFIKAADKYNINIPSLSNIKEEQNLLLENFLSDSWGPSGAGAFTSRYNGGVRSHSSNGGFQENSSTMLTKFKFGPRSGLWIETGKYLAKKAGPLSYKSNLSLSNLKQTMSYLAAKAESLDNSLEFKQVQSPSGTLLDVSNVAQQFITYQSKETELFLDYHAPKSFNSLSSIKYYSLIQQPLGTIVCQIYSGLLTQQIAKNILVIGSTLSSNSSAGRSSLANAASFGGSGIENLQKTLLIQALAGETEIKMITDNASRYAIVNRGFAVGIKYLKEVFDAITLNTPCLFLLEDIHLIGERRPQLISDHGDSVGSADGMNKSIDAAFGSQRSGDAVHEKNQIYYQLSRHAITHYKKPFKGDFSLAIPTNHFSFDLFLKSRSNNFINNPGSAFLTHPLSYGINIFDTEHKGDKANQATNLNTKLTSKRSLKVTPGSKGATEKLSSSQLLKLSNNTLLAPPSTSPFSVLLLKEQKKLKATKIVKEIPWIGLPTEQLSLLPRVSYSVRAKVSALAELGFTNMSAKLDMITDLLVIIDSVRSHRGFVVFATTHLPHLLDPALRRPGRLDETISIPTISNLWTRWEFSKSSINSTYLNAVGKTDSITVALNKSTAVMTANYLTNGVTGHVGTYNLMDFFNLDFATNLNTNFFSPIAHGFTKITNKTLIKTISPTTLEPKTQASSDRRSELELKTGVLSKKYCRGAVGAQTKVSHIAYYQMGKKLIASTNSFKVSNLAPVYLNPTISDSTNSISEINEMILNYGPEALKYKSFYSSPRNIQNILIGLLSGKFTEIFAFKSFIIPTSSTLDSKSTLSKSTLFKLHQSSLASPVNAVSSSNTENYKDKLQQNFMSLYGIDETWRAATSFALSFVQKRYLFNKNLIVPKLLNLANFSSLEEAPSPPASNILIPAKRYENYKKSLKENVQFKLSGFTNAKLQSKLQNHIKQAFIKNIYTKVQKTTNINQMVSEEYLKAANNSLLKLAAADLNRTLFIQSTNANLFYENKIYYRHRLALNNQWWNAQLTEHSAETLFLSDIDWRYTFIQRPLRGPDISNASNKSNNLLNLGALSQIKATQKTFLTNLGSNGGPSGAGAFTRREKQVTNSNNLDTTQSQRRDILIDFPDADQFYNPKQRRWNITSGYWSSWFNLDKNLQNDIFDCLMFESVMNIYDILNNNREVLDYSAAKFMKKGLIKESDVTTLLNSFT